MKPGIPLVVGSLDHHVAALGAGVGSLATCSESTGTVLACLYLTDKFRPARNLCTGTSFAAGEFYQLAFDGNGAGMLEWYQREYASQYSFPELDELAAAISPDCDGLVAKPSANTYEGLNGFENRTENHTQGHFVRAIMTSVTETLGDLLNAFFP